MSWLLDTCALSEYVRKTPAPEVIRWLDEQDESSLFISVISLGEIEKGILKLRAAELSGQPLPVMDGLIMATAQCYGLTVVTRNAQDFTLYPQVFNPWVL